MSGKNPAKHGIFGFVDRDPSTLELFIPTSTNMRCKTLWEILSEHGNRVVVMNVPVTYPPAPINGFVIGGMLSPVSGAFTYPADLLDRYAAQMKPYRIAPHVQYKPGNEAEFVADLLDLVDERLAD